MAAAFISPLDLRQLVDAKGDPVLSDSGRSQWAFLEPLQCTDAAGNHVTVPAIGTGQLSDADLYDLWSKGRVMTTDLASIPREVWPLLPPDGPWARPAAVHDFLYKTKGTCVFDGQTWSNKPGGYSRGESDQLLDDLMAAVGVPQDQRVIIFEGVRAGGWVGWGS